MAFQGYLFYECWQFNDPFVSIVALQTISFSNRWSTDPFLRSLAVPRSIVSIVSLQTIIFFRSLAERSLFTTVGRSMISFFLTIFLTIVGRSTILFFDRWPSNYPQFPIVIGPPTIPLFTIDTDLPKIPFLRDTSIFNDPVWPFTDRSYYFDHWAFKQSYFLYDRWPFNDPFFSIVGRPTLVVQRSLFYDRWSSNDPFVTIVGHPPIPFLGPLAVQRSLFFGRWPSKDLLFTRPLAVQRSLFSDRWPS